MGLVRKTMVGAAASFFAASVAVSGAPAVAAATAPVYRVDAVVADGHGTAVNEAGDFVGWKTVDGAVRAFVYKAGHETLLPTPADRPLSLARDINDTGTVVGYAYKSVIDEPGDAFRWTEGTSGWTATDLGVLPSDLVSEATGINNAGTIVGHSNKRSALDHENAFTYTNASGLRPAAAGTSFVPQDINEFGIAAGNGWSSAGILNTNTDTITDLPAPAPFALSHAFAINDNGQVAGALTTASGNAQVVARYSSATGWQNLGGISGGSIQNIGWGINGAGTVVGTGWPRTGTAAPYQRGVIYLDSVGRLEYVDTFLETGSEWTITAAYDINDAGQIVGTARNLITGQRVGVRLSPVTSAVTPDTSAPLVQIASPVAGASVWGIVNVSGPATDNVAVKQVKLRVGTKPARACTLIAPDSYTCRWDTRTTAKGAKKLKVVAVDAAGNKATYTTTVIVKRK